MGNNLPEQNIVDEFRAFGLLKNEIDVYLTLSRIGACPAGVIARRLGTNRMAVYRTLKSLEEKGLVESTLERPTKFVPLSVADFLDRHIGEIRTKVSSLENLKSGIVEYHKHLGSSQLDVEEPKFRIVQGRKHIFDQIMKMLEKAKREVCIIQTKNGLYRFVYAGIDGKLREIHDNNADVLVLTQVDESSAEAAKSYLKFAEVRHASLPSTTRMVLVDDTEALTTFARDDSMSLTTEKDIAMWIRAPDYVKSMKIFFDALWKNGTLAEQKILAINAKQELMHTLSLAAKALDAKGWTTVSPGKLIGESGVEHTFDLIAKFPDKGNICFVVDLMSGHRPDQILSLDLKVLDTRPTAQLLVMNEAPSRDEEELASRHKIKMICASKSRQLVAAITREAGIILNDKK